MLDPLLNANANTSYPPLPNDWMQMFAGFQPVDKIGSNLSNSPPEIDVPILYFFGDNDSIVPPYQAKLYKDTYDAAHSTAGPMGSPLTFDTLYPRIGGHHGSRDLDSKDREEGISFFDQELRGISDADRDGLEDTNETGLTAGFSDTDGDGQMDGNEYIHSGDNITEAVDPSSKFQITSMSKKLDPTQTEWDIELYFDGKGSTAADYVLQSCKWLLKDDGNGSFRTYPRWKDMVQSPMITNLSTGKFKATFNRAVNSGSDEKYYRVALVSTNSNFNSVTTAPVGIKKGRIRRENHPQTGTSTAKDVVNLICSPFHNPDERRVAVLSKSNIALVTTWVTHAGLAMPFSARGKLQTLPLHPTNTSDFEYYVIIQKDFSKSSNRAGRSSVPPPVYLPSPEDHGIEGHWWFLDGASANSITITERHSYLTQAFDLPLHSSVSIRKLISLADLFDGLKNTAAGAPVDSWLRASAGAPSPFVHGDKIRFLKRGSHNVVWETLGSFSPPIASQATITFDEMTNPRIGQWRDETTNAVVKLEDYRLMPDEAIQYIAKPANYGLDYETYWNSGFVSTSDIYAYVNSLAGTATLPINPPTTNFGGVEYGRSTIGWPFPTDSRLATYSGQSTMFFDSGLTMKMNKIDAATGLRTTTGTLGQSNLPSTDTAGAVMYYTDYLGPNYIGDSPLSASVVWGDFTGEFFYYAPALPLIRSVDVRDPSQIVYGTNLAAEGGTVVNSKLKLRGGRGYNILMNRKPGEEHMFLQEWRMRRPYRRP